MLNELLVYVYTLEQPYIWSTLVLAILLAPHVSRARSRLIRYLRIFSWIVLGFILGVGLANFSALPLPLRG